MRLSFGPKLITLLITRRFRAAHRMNVFFVISVLTDVISGYPDNRILRYIHERLRFFSLMHTLRNRIIAGYYKPSYITTRTYCSTEHYQHISALIHCFTIHWSWRMLINLTRMFSYGWKLIILQNLLTPVDRKRDERIGRHSWKIAF